MDNSKRIFTVPNVLTFFRIVAVPVMMYFVIASGYGQPEWFLYIGLGINILAALTDLVDGWIARRFHQISDLGKLIDPFADKFMTIGMFVALVVTGNVHWAFLLLIGLKELIMVAVGALILPKRKIIIPSNMYGKVAMWFVTIGILMSFFHKYLKYVFFLDWIVLGVGTILTYAALVSYALILKKKLSEPKEEPEAGTNDEPENGSDAGSGKIPEPPEVGTNDEPENGSDAGSGKIPEPPEAPEAGAKFSAESDVGNFDAESGSDAGAEAAEASETEKENGIFQEETERSDAGKDRPDGARGNSNGG